MKVSRLPMTVALAVTALSAASLLAAGCGGGGTNSVVAAPSLGTGTTSSAFAGRYVSTLAMGTNQTGAVAFTVAADGTAAGTLTVTTTAETRQAQSFSFGAGTYAIQGTVDPTTGAFTLTGSVGGQLFSFAGTLPAPGNNFIGGAYTLTAGGQTYSGSFANPNATPTPAPTPTPGTTPTPTPAPTPTPGTPTGNGVSLTLCDINGVTDIDTLPFTTANNTLLNAYPYGQPGSVFCTLTVVANSTVTGSTDPNRSRRFAVQFGGVEEATTGRVYTLPTTGQASCGCQFYQFEDNNGLSPSGRLYNATGGTVTVVNRTATSITVRLSNVTLVPGNYIAGLPTSGTFTVNGEITAPIGTR